MVIAALLDTAMLFAPVRPLDWERMFLGEEKPLFLVEVAIRTTIIFVYTLLLLRVLGR